MARGNDQPETASTGRNWRRAGIGALGVVVGGVFLWLALRHVDAGDLERALGEMQGKWLIAGVAVYLAAIGLRCLRWGILLRATGSVKWRHAAEALLTGFAANYILPGRVGELFRADYARRVFNMSRFTALGTIVVERVCDGVVLVCALWIGFAWISLTRLVAPEKSWVVLVGTAASLLFGAALLFILLSQRIDLRRLGMIESIAARWDRLIAGVASVLRGHAAIVALCSIGIWALEALTLISVARSLGVSLSPPESLMLLGLASLSTLIPTAPGYVGTYQLVFAHVFQMFGYQQATGFIAATAMQIFCFGTVTILGGIVLLSRSGLTIWRASTSVSSERL